MSPFDAMQEAWALAPRGVEGGLLAAVACAVLGVLLRWRRLVWAGFAVPQASTVGLAFALGASTLLPAFGLVVPPWLHGYLEHDGLAFAPGLAFPDVAAFLATALAALWLLPVGRDARRGGERGAAACFLLATTVVVLLVSRSPHGTEEIRAIATGKTLLFLDGDDLTVLRVGMPALLVLGLALARPTAAIAFDRDHARVAGRPVVRVELALAVAVASLCALLAPRAGAPFVFAYLTLPAAAAERVAARPLATAVAAALLGGLGSLVGAAASVRYDLPFSTAAAGGALAVAGAVLLLHLFARAVVARGAARVPRSTPTDERPGRGRARRSSPT